MGRLIFAACAKIKPKFAHAKKEESPQPSLFAYSKGPLESAVIGVAFNTVYASKTMADT